MRKALEYLGITIAVLLMAVAVFAYIGPHVGWRLDAVLTGSMAPELEVGSLVFTRSVEPETIAVGDIITFRPAANGQALITHRVIGVGRSSSLYFETKGDANATPDRSTVPARNVVGKVSFNVPYWGFAIEFLKTPLGFLFALVIPGTVLIALYAISVYRAVAGSRRQTASRQLVAALRPAAAEVVTNED